MPELILAISIVWLYALLAFDIGERATNFRIAAKLSILFIVIYLLIILFT